jgi:hypothetical protein
LIALFAVVSAGVARAEFKLKDSDRVIIFGDRAVSDPFSMVWIDQFLRIRYPEFQGAVYRFGKEGSTAEDGNSRLATEVLALNHTHVILCFGLDELQHVAMDDARLENFVEQMRKLIDASSANDVQVALMTPPPTDQRRNAGLGASNADAGNAQIADAVRVLAEERKLPLIDWHKAMKDWIGAAAESPEMEWTDHGLVPAGISYAMGASLLLEHWGAEPLDYLVSIDWVKPEPCTANIGSVEVKERSDGKLLVALTGAPVPLEPRGRGTYPAERWPLAKWCKYRLQLTGLTDTGVVISENLQYAKPFLATQLAEGADLSVVGPMVDCEASRKLYAAVSNKLANAIQAQNFNYQKPPEPELERGYALLHDAYYEIANAAHKIAYRTPSRMDMVLTIETAAEAAKHPAPPKPAGPMPRPPGRKPKPTNG